MVVRRPGGKDKHGRDKLVKVKVWHFFLILLCLAGCQLAFGFWYVEKSSRPTRNEHGRTTLPYHHHHDTDSNVSEKVSPQNVSEKISSQSTLPRPSDPQSDGLGPQKFETFSHKVEPCVLIIGGSDGSGTRAFVDVIRNLGVPVVADDPVSFDVHGEMMFSRTKQEGWPGLVNLAIGETHSANYNFGDLTDAVKRKLSAEVMKFQRIMDRKAEFARSKVKTHPAKAISYAFKAPIAMVLLPIMTEYFGHIRFLHIVRDGRDVSFSKNQSPVEKFYKIMYADHMNRSEIFKDNLSPVKAMHLWNDWNVQVYQWAVSHSDKVDYLAMRSEDLVNPDTRVDSIHRLARFVGSTHEEETLCCLGREKTRDFGESGNHDKLLARYNGEVVKGGKRGGRPFGRDAPNPRKAIALEQKQDALQKLQETLEHQAAALKRREDRLKAREAVLQQQDKTAIDAVDASRRRLSDVHSRYGKWQGHLANDTRLSGYIHEAGAEGLGLFGYEPFKPLPYGPSTQKALDCSNYTCGH